MSYIYIYIYIWLQVHVASSCSTPHGMAPGTHTHTHTSSSSSTSTTSAGRTAATHHHWEGYYDWLWGLARECCNHIYCTHFFSSSNIEQTFFWNATSAKHPCQAVGVATGSSVGSASTMSRVMDLATKAIEIRQQS